MTIRWVSCVDERNGVSRMAYAVGHTKKIVVTGLPPGFAGNCSTSFDLPPDARVHPYPEHESDGVTFTVLDRPEAR